MFGVRILLFIVAFGVVVAEEWAGVIATEPVQKAFAIGIGGLVIALLLGVSMFVLGRSEGPNGQQISGSAGQWAAVLIAGLGISAGSFFMPSVVLPMLTAGRIEVH